MSAGSGIQWTDATWNPVSGCTRVSSGCDSCYAVMMTHRLEMMGQVEKYGGLTVLNPKEERHFNGVVRVHEEALAIPLHWKKPRRIFVNSMSDLFHKGVSFEFVDKVFAVMALCPQHTFQVLTKRPARMADYLQELDGKHWPAGGFAPERIQDICVYKYRKNGITSNDHKYRWPLPNVWLGTSCENQAAADERIPWLLKSPAAVRFLSCEPLLGVIDLANIHNGCIGYFPLLGKAVNYEEDDATMAMANHSKIHWVIVGGESGAGARGCDVEWIRGIVRQCQAAGVAVFCKQLGAKPYQSPEKDGGTGYVLDLKDKKGGDMAEWAADLRVRQMPGDGSLKAVLRTEERMGTSALRGEDGA